ncbi:MAG TPA: hypothetical protein VD962_10585, partial [Rubricoccaceae bacterium]|nr:hypothetical protein [Rubricoccaceae bacterium]
MRPTLLFLLALAVSPALAQDYVIGAERGGGTASDVGEDAAVDVAGNTAVVGTFEGTATFGTVSLTSAGQGDFFVVKYDSQRQPLWARRGGTSVFNDFAEGVAFDGDGNVFVAGYFTGVATFDGGDNPDTTLTTRSDFDAFLAKYDPNGNLLWVRQGGGVGQDTGRGIALDDEGNAYFGGGYEGTAWFEADTLTSAGSSDGFLVKYAPDGAVLWARSVGGPESDGIWNVAVSDERVGDVIAAVGTFRGVAFFGTIPMQSRGNSDLFAFRIDPQGSVVWAQQVGGGGFDYGRGIDVVGFGGVYVTGSFEGTILVGTDVLTSAGASDVLVAQLDESSGALQWGRRGGGAGFDIGNDLALSYPCCAGVSVAVTGYIDAGPSTFDAPNQTLTLTSRGFTDGFFVDYMDGDVLDGTLIGGTNADRGWGIGSAPHFGRLALTGAFRGAAQAGTFTLTSVGSNDVYVVTIDDCRVRVCGDANEPDAEGSSLRLLLASMNPARGDVVLSLTTDRPQPVVAEVFDAL